MANLPVVTRKVEWHVLTLVTLGLTAFGIVMVYSATSASAAIGGANPMSYLERQGTYAVIGIAGMLFASRFDYRRLRALAPVLILVALGGCAAVLIVAPPINGARRWIGLGPAAFQPSELAKLALAIWLAAWLSRREPPQTLGELWRPIGALVGLFSVLIIFEPDLGTTIALVVMVGCVLLVAGTPMRVLGGGFAIATALGLVAVWIEPYRRARFFSFLNPWHDAQGAGYQIVQAQIGIGSGGFFGKGLGAGRAEDPLPARRAHRHDLRRHRRGARPDRLGRADPRVRGVRVGGPEDRAGVQGPVRQAPRRRADGARLLPGRDQPRGGAGAGAADGNSAAVRVVRRVEPRCRARLCRHPP